SDEMRAVRFTEFVDRNDVGMIESRNGSGLADKPAHALSIFGEFRWQSFQRNLAVELSVLGKVHFSHSAFADLRANFVMTQTCARCKSRIHTFEIFQAKKVTGILSERVKVRLTGERSCGVAVRV